MSVVVSCRDAATILADEKEGTLAGAEKASFSFHMAICVFCRRYRDQLKTTVGMLRALPDGKRGPEPEPAEVDAILAMLTRPARPADDDGEA